MPIPVGVYGERPTAREAAKLLEESEGLAVEEFATWSAVRRRRADLHVLVLVLPRDRRELARLRGRWEEGALPRLVLVTEDPEQAALALHRLRIDELVELDRVRKELADAVGRAALPPPLEEVARRLRAAGSLPDPVGKYVFAALRARKPFTRVGELLRHLGVPRRTFHRHWARAFPNSTAKELLDWVLLMHALERKSPSRSWTRVAAHLSVSPDTLRRIARRRVGRNLQQLELPDVREAFTRYVRAGLL